MALAFAAPPLRITGPGGLLAEIEVYTRISRQREYSRTETALERGAALTIHRQRVPQPLVLEIIASDVEQVPGALSIGLWEFDHAAKTLARLEALQAADSELTVFLGTEFARTPAGIKVWVLDNIDDSLEGGEVGVLKATLTFGESPRFATQFTNALDNVAEGLEDVVGGSAERGRQSTTSASPDTTAAVGAAVWP